MYISLPSEDIHTAPLTQMEATSALQIYGNTWNHDEFTQSSAKMIQVQVGFKQNIRDSASTSII